MSVPLTLGAGSYIAASTFVNGSISQVGGRVALCDTNTTIYLVPSSKTLTESVVFTKIILGDIAIGTHVDVEFFLMVYEANTNSQSFAISTPNGLLGIPVASGGNYTDGNGQRWICDEIDFERGVFVQRIKTKRVNANATWFYSDTSTRFYALDAEFEKVVATTPVRAMCTHFRANTDSTLEDLEITFVNDITSGYAYRYDALNGDLSAWKAFLTENEVFISGVLATPIETPLTAEQIEAYKALHTNKPNTTIINDENAYMTVKYIADPKSYIDNKVASAILTATVE